MFLIKAIPYVFLLLMVFSCKKDSSPPEPDFVPSPYGDTGINYQATAVCNYNLDETVLTSGGWTKAFEDNFDTNLSKWNLWTGGSYNNNELQHYQPANLQLSGGELAVVAKKEDVTGATNPSDQSQKSFKFTSGRIDSKTVFSADATTPKVRIVARIKLPTGFGMNPAFVTSGVNWPTEGQIDLIIAYENDPTKYTTNYYYGTKAGQNIVESAFGFITANADLTACYHVYEMEWSKDALSFFLDGKLVERKTTGGRIPDLFGKKQNLSLYLGVSSDFLFRSRIQPGTLKVDWVKVFTAK